MRKVFKDPSLQLQLEKDGLVTVPFLDSQGVTSLLEFYESQQKHFTSGFHVTMFVESLEYRQAVDRVLKAAYQASCEKYFERYRPLYANFMVKEPGLEGDFPVHQDWSYVDEEEFRSVAIWVPLLDVDESNGAMSFVKGSHDFIRTPRGPQLKSPYEQLNDVIKEKYLTNVPLKAGEAVIWDHSLIHCSPPNNTRTTRLASTVIMVPEEADVIHYFRHPDDPLTRVERFKVDTEFYMNYKIGQRPEHTQSDGFIECEIEDMSEDRLRGLYEGKKNGDRKSIFSLIREKLLKN